MAGSPVDPPQLHSLPDPGRQPTRVDRFVPVDSEEAVRGRTVKHRPA